MSYMNMKFNEVAWDNIDPEKVSLGWWNGKIRIYVWSNKVGSAGNELEITSDVPSGLHKAVYNAIDKGI